MNTKFQLWANRCLLVAGLIGLIFSVKFYLDVKELKAETEKLIQNTGKVSVSVSEIEDDAGVNFNQPIVVDAGTSVRPTAEQLAREYILSSELRELLRQATSSEDKALIQQALDIKAEQLKKYELSQDFEKNMRRAIH